MLRTCEGNIYCRSRNLPNTDVTQLKYKFTVISEAPSTMGKTGPGIDRIRNEGNSGLGSDLKRYGKRKRTQQTESRSDLIKTFTIFFFLIIQKYKLTKNI